MSIKYILLCLCTVMSFSCTQSSEKLKQTGEEISEPLVVMETTLGEITLKLYNETPKHRDNFLKLVREQRYDSLLFHRVIENFMVQAGDPDSKFASDTINLGSGDLEYTVPAEFHPDRFHKRGALGAARNGNIARASSAMQFYIVQGRTYTDSTLQIAEGRINKWLAENEIVNNTRYNAWTSVWNEFSLEKRKISDDSIRLLRTRIDSLATIRVSQGNLYSIPKAHRLTYKTNGGAAHLDQNYTVFGEIVSGMSIIDSIAAVSTNDMDRPLENIRILKAQILQLK